MHHTLHLELHVMTHTHMCVCVCVTLAHTSVRPTHWRPRCASFTHSLSNTCACYVIYTYVILWMYQSAQRAGRLTVGQGRHRVSEACAQKACRGQPAECESQQMICYVILLHTDTSTYMK